MFSNKPTVQFGYIYTAMYILETGTVPFPNFGKVLVRVCVRACVRARAIVQACVSTCVSVRLCAARGSVNEKDGGRVCLRVRVRLSVCNPVYFGSALLLSSCTRASGTMFSHLTRCVALYQQAVQITQITDTVRCQALS